MLSALGHSVRAIDLPGLGDDDTPADSVTADDWAIAVADAARAMDRPAVLVGHSLGGRRFRRVRREPRSTCAD